MAKRKIMDVSGIPFVVEEREDGLFAVGIKVRKRWIRFEGSGLPVDIIDKLDGVSGNEKIDGLQEMEEFLEGMPESSKLVDSIPEGFVSDEEVMDTWQQAMQTATNKE